MMCQQLQKICSGKVCPTQVFQANLGKFGQNILRNPK